MVDMAIDDSDQSLPEGVEQQLNEAGAGKKQEDDNKAVYKVVSDARIPISKSAGKIWKGRRDAAVSNQKEHMDAGDEAIKYFHHDQMDHRDGRTPRTPGNVSTARRINGLLSETENVVFSNITTLVPALYSKDPQVEFTSVKSDDESRQYAVMMRHLVNTLFVRKADPCVNLKPKAKKGIVIALLTNAAWAECGYTLKQDSSESALTDLQRISKAMGDKETSTKEYEQLEGQLQALEDTIDMLRPSGPFVRICMHNQILVDPNSEEPDHSDAAWMMRWDMIQTDFIVAKYGKRDADGDNFKSIYEPTHVLSAAEGTETEDLNNFKIFAVDVEGHKYGYGTKDAFEKAKYTKVWFVWDKLTRRVYMYNDKDWSWPIWVWNDPYHLDSFFPFHKLSMHTSPTQPLSKGETTYYLDQQDAINEINDEERRARLWVKRNILYDKNKLDRDDAEAFLKGDDGTARGVDVPEGMKISDCILTPAVPSLNFPQLFNKEPKFQAIDKITGLTDVLRGAQFKTNTTNQAIDNYNASTNMRIDEKIDALEDWIGAIGWSIAQMCAQFMDQDTVSRLIDPDLSQLWRNLSPDEIRFQFNMQCVGGSTQKPTSQAKKKEAVQLAQTLGQFANAAPGVVLSTVMKIFSQAFDEVTFTEDDWQKLQTEVQQSLQQGSTAPGGPQQAGNGAGQPQQPQAPGHAAPAQHQQQQPQHQLPAPQPAQQQQPQQQQGGNPAQAVFAQLDALPPPAKKALATAFASGVPLEQALQHLQQLAHQARGAA